MKDQLKKKTTSGRCTQNTACWSAQKIYLLNSEEVLLKIVVRGLFSQQLNFEQWASHSPTDKQSGQFCHLRWGADSLVRIPLRKIEQLAMTFKLTLLLVLLFVVDHAAAESKKGPKILTSPCCTWIWFFFYRLFHVHPFLCILGHLILHERRSDRIRAVEYVSLALLVSKLAWISFILRATDNCQRC